MTILRQRRPSIPLEDAQEPEGPSANQQAEERLRLRELVADLGSLPERQRGALVMRELSGLSYSEIGSAFGTSSAAAKQTVYEARSALHEIAGGREMDCEAVRQALSANEAGFCAGASFAPTCVTAPAVEISVPESASADPIWPRWRHLFRRWRQRGCCRAWWAEAGDPSAPGSWGCWAVVAARRSPHPGR